jgi:hydroxyethylthiazole kinase
VTSHAALDAARRLAAERGTIVAVSGATDYITDGAQTWAVSRGHPWMARVSGTGCALSAVVAAFLGAADDRLRAAAAACGLMAICGERASARSGGPGSFVPAFLDELHAIQPDDLLRDAP